MPEKPKTVNVQLRVLQICSSGSPGGGPAHVRSLSEELSARGHNVCVACRPKSYLIDWLKDKNISVYAVPLRNALELRSIILLNRIVRQNNIQLIHAHNGRDFPFCYFLNLLNPSVNYVFTRHYVKLNKSNYFTRRVFSNAARIVTVSEGIRQRMIDHFQLNEKQVETIPNWVDTEKYRSSQSVSSAKKKFSIKTQYAVAVIGRLVPTKGQEEFVRAGIKISKKRDDVTFLVVGLNEYANDNSYVQRLRDLIGENHCNDKIRLLPWQEDLSHLFPALTIVVTPSWLDAFNIVLIEAMSAGVAVIAADMAGPGEIIVHNSTGLLVPPKNPDSLAQAIEHLLDNDDVRQKIEIAAKVEVQRKYSVRRVIAQVERVYRESIRRK